MRNTPLALKILFAVGIVLFPFWLYTVIRSPASEANAGSKHYSTDLDGQLRRVRAMKADSLAAPSVTDTSITYEQLKKNADRYAGQAWEFEGEIIQINESGGGTVARIGLDEFNAKVMYVAAPFTTDFVENDRVRVIGYLAGNNTYTSEANWSITLPALVAFSIDRAGERNGSN